MTGDALTTTTALRKACQHALARLEALAPLICADDDPEDLHDFRVTVRRTRSILGSFQKWANPEASTALRSGLKQIAASTDRLRDLDVLLQDHSALCERLPDTLREGCAELEAQLYSTRSAAHAELVQYLVADAFAQTLQQCRNCTAKLDLNVHDHPLHVIAARVTPRRIARLQRRSAQLPRSAPDFELHQLRIAGKKMRYMLDFLEPVLPAKKRRRALKSLKQAQDDLGRFHDLCVQQALFEQLLQQGTPSRALSLTLAGLIANIHARRNKRRTAARKTVVAFSGAELTLLARTLQTSSRDT